MGRAYDTTRGRIAMIQRQITRPMSRELAGVFMDKIRREYPKSHCHITWNPSNEPYPDVRVVVLNAPKRLPLTVNPLGV